MEKHGSPTAVPPIPNLRPLSSTWTQEEDVRAASSLEGMPTVRHNEMRGKGAGLLGRGVLIP